MFPARGSFRHPTHHPKTGLTKSPEPESTLNGSSNDAFVQKRKPTNKFGYADKPTASPETLINQYMQGEMHPVSLLHQLAQILDFHLEIKETIAPSHVKVLCFAFCVVIDGIKYQTGTGITKKVARHEAAELALTDLLPTICHSVSPVSSDVLPPPPSSDLQPSRHENTSSVSLQIPHAVRDQLSKLMNSHPEFSSCAGTVAAFIMQTSSGYEVVALGTGNYNANQSVLSTGRIVHDSHAVVTARRSLMRFLYRHLLMFFSKTDNLKGNSIFQQNSNSSLLSLKNGLTLHLYMNQLPKGAAETSNMRLNPSSMLAWEYNNEISLHMSVEGKVFSVFLSTSGNSTFKMASMSPTDKLTQWQVLGYQGALLSHFIEPIYVESILIGTGDIGCSGIHGMKIQSQRVEGIDSQLPKFYSMIMPYIRSAPSVATNSIDDGQLTYSINWSEGDTSLEVVDGLEGKTVEESPFKSGPALASRLCKAAMLHRFKSVAKEAQRQDLLKARSYREAKRMAKSYQEARNVLRVYLLQQGFGHWLVKLSVSDNFNV